MLLLCQAMRTRSDIGLTTTLLQLVCRSVTTCAFLRVYNWQDFHVISSYHDFLSLRAIEFSFQLLTHSKLFDKFPILQHTALNRFEIYLLHRRYHLQSVHECKQIEYYLQGFSRRKSRVRIFIHLNIHWPLPGAVAKNATISPLAGIEPAVQ